MMSSTKGSHERWGLGGKWGHHVKGFVYLFTWRDGGGSYGRTLSKSDRTSGEFQKGEQCEQVWVRTGQGAGHPGRDLLPSRVKKKVGKGKEGLELGAIMEKPLDRSECLPGFCCRGDKFLLEQLVGRCRSLGILVKSCFRVWGVMIR